MNPGTASNKGAFQALANSHYENFPVASWLLPAGIRSAVATIYTFARQADDYADEGELEASERLQLFDAFRNKLDLSRSGDPVNDPLFESIREIVHQHNLPWHAFYDLLSAFAQDVSVTRYNTYADLLDYCSRSANPVGLLLLHLVNRAQPELVEKSNAVCSALQIINFLQDIAVDFEKGRIYLPQEDMNKFGVSERHIENMTFDPAWQQLIDFQIDRVEKLMLSGADLPQYLAGRMKYEIRATVTSGLHVIKLLRSRNREGFSNQPRLGAGDWVMIGLKTLLYRYK